MSEVIQGALKSRCDGLEIAAMAVVPERPYRGIFQIVHGMSENKERYLPFMEFLAEEGYVAVIHDHRGHGRSVRDEKDLGYMYGGGADGLLDDILQINEILKNRFPEAPLVLFGHSMGSLAVRAFTRKYGDEGHMDALVVCGSPSKNSARPIGEFLARLAKARYGDRHVCSRLEKLSFGGYAKKFPGETSPACWVCSDKRVVEEYDASPLCGFTFTADAYLVLFDLMKQSGRGSAGLSG